MNESFYTIGNGLCFTGDLAEVYISFEKKIESCEKKISDLEKIIQVPSYIKNLSARVLALIIPYVQEPPDWDDIIRKVLPYNDDDDYMTSMLKKLVHVKFNYNILHFPCDTIEELDSEVFEALKRRKHYKQNTLKWDFYILEHYEQVKFGIEEHLKVK